MPKDLPDVEPSSCQGPDSQIANPLPLHMQRGAQGFMDALVVTESRFLKTSSGDIYALNPILSYDFWTRYLDVFSRIQVTGRVERIAKAPSGLPAASGKGVAFLELPNWNSPWQYLQYHAIIKRLLESAAVANAVYLRSPTQVAAVLGRQLVQRGQPYGIEVVGDPWDALAPGSVSTRLRGILRWRARTDLERLCRNAVASAYVTRRALQERYPPRVGAYTTSFSSITLQDRDFVHSAKRWASPPFRLVHVGTMGAALYKAQDTILHAFRKVLSAFPQTVLTLVGGGQRENEIRTLAERLDMNASVRFTGFLSGPEAVRAILDESDLFLLPSLTEGLPKALVEAMARGLPAIGSTVGGIPELLGQECLVPPRDVGALADKIVRFLGDPEFMAQMAADNLRMAQEYHIDQIRPRRIRYYQEVANATACWLAAGVTV